MRGPLLLLAVVVSFAQPSGYEVTTSKRVMVPMRDGVRLATDIIGQGAAK